MAPHARAQQGFAMLLAIVAITILSVLVTDLHETTGTSFAAAMSERDQLRAEYMAKSGVNLTRMLVAQETNIRNIPQLQIMFKLALGRPPPQLPVWQYANMILKPFSDFDGSKEDAVSAGFDLDMSEGLGETHATFEVAAVAENGKINLNDPMLKDAAQSRAQVASQLYSLMGGYQPSPNMYDPLFSQFDEKNRLTTRLDVVANVIDWWDLDEQRSSFDPVLGAVTSTGAEDVDYYRTLPSPYAIKNAPFDTIEELRLVRGISDDVWATFVEPDIDDPKSRQVTIYGASKVNPNEADPKVMLARICTFPSLHQQLLCSDPTGQEPLKFISLIGLARSLAPIPWFSRPTDFVSFISGQQDGLYGKLSTMLTTMNMQNMMFAPLTLAPNSDDVKQLRRTFATSSRIISVEVTGKSGHAQRRIRTVLNFDQKWTPPPPNAGAPPPLGIYCYYRID